MRRRVGWIAVALAIGILAGWAAVTWRATAAVDVVITGGTVVDGTGTPGRLADVGIASGRIVWISGWRGRVMEARRVIDATGRVVAPGFIDVHTHVEPNIPARAVFRAANFLRQGVTTILTGNCGRSAPDIARLFDGIVANGSQVNVGTFVGHNTVRDRVMGSDAVPASPEQVARMRRTVAAAMEAGALGLSFGLAYVPGRYSEAKELAALAEEVSGWDGVCNFHLRDEGRAGEDAVREALDATAASGAHVHISHFKNSGRTEWFKLPERLALLDAARATGRRVTIDVYPYTRSSTTTDVLLPDWAVGHDREGLRQALRQPAVRRRLAADIRSRFVEAGWEDLAHVTVAAGRPEWVGYSIAELAAGVLGGGRPAPTPLDRRQRPAEAARPESGPSEVTATDPAAADSRGGDAASVAQAPVDRQIEALIRLSMRGGAQAIYADMVQEDVDAAIACPWAAIGSDSAVRDPDARSKPHPRGSGTFPRIFREFVRERGLLSLEEAVRKATGLAAAIFSIPDRGTLRPGAWADVVVFDPATVADRADYAEPLAAPVGIEYVLVNGVVAIDRGVIAAGGNAGQPVRREPSRPRRAPDGSAGRAGLDR